jgi:hypothetical protein
MHVLGEKYKSELKESESDFKHFSNDFYRYADLFIL